MLLLRHNLTVQSLTSSSWPSAFWPMCAQSLAKKCIVCPWGFSAFLTWGCQVAFQHQAWRNFETVKCPVKSTPMWKTSGHALERAFHRLRVKLKQKAWNLCERRGQSAHSPPPHTHTLEQSWNHTPTPKHTHTLAQSWNHPEWWFWVVQC